MGKRLIILTGAGLSAESGIPTFRDNDGLWENHRIQDVCHYPTWKNNAALVHAFYNARRQSIEAAQPNEAHKAIARWQKQYETVLLTQNIDDLLEKAGATNVIHLHGEITSMHCTACDSRWQIGYRPWNHEEERCPKCNSRRGVKPNVVFFGEMAPEYRRLHKTIESLRQEDTLLVIGTSGVVLPIAQIAATHQGTSILNNLREEENIPSRLFTHCFYEPATSAVQKIDSQIRKDA